MRLDQPHPGTVGPAELVAQQPRLVVLRRGSRVRERAWRPGLDALAHRGWDGQEGLPVGQRRQLLGKDRGWWRKSDASSTPKGQDGPGIMRPRWPRHKSVQRQRVRLPPKIGKFNALLGSKPRRPHGWRSCSLRSEAKEFTLPSSRLDRTSSRCETALDASQTPAQNQVRAEDGPRIWVRRWGRATAQRA